MKNTQSGILTTVTPAAKYLVFSLKLDADPREALTNLSKIVDGNKVVVGIGESLALAMDTEIAGLRAFPHYERIAVDIPSTPFSLWCWLRGADRGELIHQSRLIQRTLDDSFHLEHATDAFQYGANLDLSGYEDGTENPEGDEAIEAAIINNIGPGMDGSSFVAVQRWIHDLDHFLSMPQQEQDHIIGRRKSDNEELDDAPVSAHTKRTEQESFQPEAFVLRRSMPWADATNEGFVFVAFGRSFDAFEAQLKRMVGVEDGITDGLFRFTRPLTGSYFWCPPIVDGHLDLTALGI